MGLLEGVRVRRWGGGRNNERVGWDVFSAKTLVVSKTRKWRWTEEKSSTIFCAVRGERGD